MRRSSLPLALAAALIPVAALAHTGPGAHTGFMAGLEHPVSGQDHVLAMVAVGLWAAMAGGRALWALPVAFVLGMVLGGGMGFAGLPLPGVEPMILASIIILGVLAAMAARLPVALSAAICLGFGVFHGHAHGAEGPGTGMLVYAAGFVAATMALHLGGIALGLGLTRLGGRVAARIAGAAAAVAGALLAMGG
ncbi:MAG: HupE/UreJ family protein [Paracoccaceae bacterium]